MSPVPLSLSSVQIATSSAVSPPQLPGAIDAGRDDAGGGVVLEALAKGAALAPVEGKHGRVERDTREGAVDHRPRNAGGSGFAPHGGQECVEIASARRRGDRRREKRDAKQDRERA